TQPYSPMTIRFFILQAHYRGTVDFSNEALQASERALGRMLEGYRRLQELTPSASSTVADAVAGLRARCYEAMDDDLNTPVVIAHLFDGLRIVNSIKDGKATATAEDIRELREVFDTFLIDILGIRPEIGGGADNAEALKPFEGAMDLILEMRAKAKAEKDWATSDLIRDRLAEAGFNIKDTKDGAEWSLK
ncbi:MAG: cysteine--tRNA ligase, partial [Duncaniella sp.]|nr:cysteine--tRNA ligase [Duncaniella sp.]